MRAFAQAERFVSELEARKLRSAYVFVGDEAFFRKRFRDAILEHLVPADLRDFSLFEYDLAETDLVEVLDRARTPSLMAPFQVFFVRGVKNLFGRGSNEEKLAAVEDYCKNPNPDALLIFVADHISIPADVRRMEMQDKERYQRILETMGRYCGIVGEAASGHIYVLGKPFSKMLGFIGRNSRDKRMLGAGLGQGFRVHPFAADDIIKQARRYKPRRELTRAIRLVAKADLALRSNPVSKRMVLERLVMDLTTEPKVEAPGWMQEQLPV